jgi:hypothetical protein
MRPLVRLALAVLACAATHSPAAEPACDRTPLFEAGRDGYALYRIPGIVATAKGALLAYCEARKSASGDWGATDLLLRRSTDGGRTWGPPVKLGPVEGPVAKNPAAVRQKLGKEGEITYNNPVAIADRSGSVHLLFCVEYNRCFYTRSDDDGQTFVTPREITAAFAPFRAEYPWQVLATGPGHGIQLRSGRLLVPVWLSTGEGGHAHRPSCVSVVASDDGGATWQRGGIVCAHPHPANPSETAAVQLADGRVMLNVRHESEPHLRAVTVSANGLTGWSPLRYDKQLPEPVCQGSVVRLSEPPADPRPRLLFVNPHNPAGRERKNLTVKLSYDEGETWPAAKAVESGPSGYADLAVGTDGWVYCLYEQGTASEKAFRPRTLTVATFNLEWLTDGRDRLAGR